jgi:hypothetical protein
MSILSGLFGNLSEISVEQAQKDYAPALAEKERVVKAFQLIRDQVVMTNLRIIVTNKMGVTGSKHEMTSIPYRSIIKFSKQSAGMFDWDSEVRIWIKDEADPIKWEFGKGVNVNEVCSTIARFVCG